MFICRNIEGVHVSFWNAEGVHVSFWNAEGIHAHLSNAKGVHGQGKVGSPCSNAWAQETRTRQNAKKHEV